MLVAVALGLLTGCSEGQPTGPTGSSAVTPSTATATADPSVVPTETAAPPPALRPEGTAADNLPYFASIVNAVWAGPDRASGRAYVDALAAGGFDKAAMQVTNDESTVGNAAESIQFSVLWAGECLIGQVGPATGDPVATVLPVVGDETCLLGRTRPIDW
ncbi:hypothetical protein EV279_2271 [Microbacterium sp. BK668]|nr:hypothetical protein EV279_2271 [Microbacterium sp. BK668]